MFGPQQPLLHFEGGPKSKQHIPNVLVNDALHASPRDRLQRALQQARPGLAAEPKLNLSGGDGPIVGDTFATLVFYEKKKLSLALFYLRALTCRGKKMADVATAEIEHSSGIMCHGQLMSVEEFPVPQLHVWNGMLVQKVLKFRGEQCRFVKLRANEDHMWFESSARLSALTSELLLNPPEFAPTIGVPPYPNLPICAINDASCTVKVGSAAPTSGTCAVCNHVVPLHSMRTHVGRHILRDECVADACGFCGSKECTTQLLRNGQG